MDGEDARLVYPMNMELWFDMTAFVVMLSIVFAAAMWWMEWRYRYPVPVWDLARIFAIAFTVQGLIYLVFSFLLVNIELRSYMVRISIIVICLSQAVPLSYAYRLWRRNEPGNR